MLSTQVFLQLHLCAFLACTSIAKHTTAQHTTPDHTAPHAPNHTTTPSNRPFTAPSPSAVLGSSSHCRCPSPMAHWLILTLLMAARSALDLLELVHPEQERPLARARDPDRPLDAMGMLALVGDTAGERPLARAAQLLQLLPRRGRTHKQKQYLASMRSRKRR